MPDAIDTAIEDLAAYPKEIESDGVKVVEQSISDLVKAAQHLDGQTAVTKAHRGLRFNQIVAPGPD